MEDSMNMITENVEVSEILNPKIWDSNGELRPEIDMQLHKIVEEFINGLAIPVKPVDVHLVGSNASFNYTDDSDLDVHVIVNFEDMDAPEEILQALYDFEKTKFNDNHEISVHGVPIELYIEDIDSNSISNGIYSLYNHEWIKFPEPIEVPTYDTSEALSRWKNEIKDAMNNGNAEEMQKLLNNLKMMRRNSLAVDGEYSEGNQLFKEIRNLGLIGALKDAKHEAVSRELTLEQLNRGDMTDDEMEWYS